MKTITFLAMLVAVPVLAGMPRVVNGVVTTAAASSDLRRQIESFPNGRVGYELPTDGEKRMFCSYDNTIDMKHVRDDLHVASAHVGVFFGVTDHRIDRVRLRSEA